MDESLGETNRLKFKMNFALRDILKKISTGTKLYQKN